MGGGRDWFHGQGGGGCEFAKHRGKNRNFGSGIGGGMGGGGSGLLAVYGVFSKIWVFTLYFSCSFEEVHILVECLLCGLVEDEAFIRFSVINRLCKVAPMKSTGYRFPFQARVERAYPFAGI